METSQERQAAPLSVRRFLRTFPLAGLLPPAVLGIVIRTVLQIQGIGVVSLVQGAAGLMSLSLLFLLPYFLLAMLIRRVLVKTPTRGELPFRRWWYVSVGAFAGMTLVCIFLLSTMLPDYEALTMVVFMWPLTFPIMLVLAVGGVFAGGIPGWLAWRIRIADSHRGSMQAADRLTNR
ncbi:MAG: hypothetical protein P8011_14630 [Acidihalobacter sp.]|uniref:hypothetical protein n=1 Tax=Acidihalobacter sp. TaxID=1872108 RepID=UPI00307E45C1